MLGEISGGRKRDPKVSAGIAHLRELLTLAIRGIEGHTARKARKR
jgi:hypothetical protein